MTTQKTLQPQATTTYGFSSKTSPLDHYWDGKFGDASTFPTFLDQIGAFVKPTAANQLAQGSYNLPGLLYSTARGQRGIDLDGEKITAGISPTLFRGGNKAYFIPRGFFVDEDLGYISQVYGQWNNNLDGSTPPFINSSNSIPSNTRNYQLKQSGWVDLPQSAPTDSAAGLQVQVNKGDRVVYRISDNTATLNPVRLGDLAGSVQFVDGTIATVSIPAGYALIEGAQVENSIITRNDGVISNVRIWMFPVPWVSYNAETTAPTLSQEFISAMDDLKAQIEDKNQAIANQEAKLQKFQEQLNALTSSIKK